MQAQMITIEINNQIAKVTLNRPEIHNAFNDKMILELTKIFSDFNQNPQVRVVILQANGKNFSAGADLNWMKSTIDYSFEENKADANNLALMLKTITECSKPVIGKVQGAVYGGGVGLISACDLVAAHKDSFFSLSEAKLGLIPAVISPFVLRKISRASAHRYFITAEKFSTKAAKEIGLVSELGDNEKEVEDIIDKWIQEIFQNGPEAVSLTKKLINETINLDLNSAMDYSTTAIAKIRSGAEGQEGMRAFLEKRKPKWLS